MRLRPALVPNPYRHRRSRCWSTWGLSTSRVPIGRNASVKRTRSSVSFRMSSKFVIGHRCTKAAVKATMLGGSGWASSGGQANTAFARFAGDDLHLGVGQETRVEGRQRRRHLAAHVLHERLCGPWLSEGRVIFVPPHV